MEWDIWNCAKSRTSYSQVFCKIGFLKNFGKFTEIHLCQGLFFNKVTSEFWQNFMRNISIEHLRATASENVRLSFVQNW